MVFVFAEIFSGLEWPTHRMLGGAIDSSAYTTDNWGYSMIFNAKAGLFHIMAKRLSLSQLLVVTSCS